MRGSMTMSRADLVRRFRQLGRIVGLDREGVGLGLVGLGQTRECGHGIGSHRGSAAIMRPGDVEPQAARRIDPAIGRS
jgi:hypothetical protein